MLSLRPGFPKEWMFILAALLCLSLPAHAVPFFWAGNGHYYDRVDLANPTWFDARNAAAASSHLGLPGHLATFTTRQEQEAVIAGLGGGALINARWLGGYQDPGDPGYSEPDGGWKWITGEAWTGVFVTTNPDPNVDPRPRSDFGFNNTYFVSPLTEEHLITWWQTGGINDYYHTPTHPGDGNGGLALGYIVEFEAAAVPEPSSALLIASGLLGLAFSAFARRSRSLPTTARNAFQ